MKRFFATALAVTILAANVFAQPDPDEVRMIGKFGHVGLWNTLSAKTLGYGRLALNVYANNALDKNWIKNIYLWEQRGNIGPERSVLLYDPQSAGLNKYTRTAMNFSVAYGVTRFLDVGFMLPLYIDNIGAGASFPSYPTPGGGIFNWPRDALGEGDDIWTNAGIGDMEISLKFLYPPYPHRNFFQMSYYGALALPTGAENHGHFPRHTYYLDKRADAAYTQGAINWETELLRSLASGYHNFTSNNVELDMKMLWTWDFREMSDYFPVLFHINYGLRWVTQHKNDHVFYLNAGIEGRPAEWISIFVDFSAAPRFGSLGQEETMYVDHTAVTTSGPNGEKRIEPSARWRDASGNSHPGAIRQRNLLDDPIRISPGIGIMTPIGITVSAGVDISLAHDYGFFFTDRTTSESHDNRAWNAGGEFTSMPTVLFETGVEPKVAFAASLGWNGLTIPRTPPAPPIEAPRDTVFIRDTVFVDRVDTVQVQVSREVPTFTVTSSVAGGQGTITPAGVNTVREGALVTYNFAPAQGFSIDQVTVNGQNVGAVPQYTFPSVMSNQIITVSFRQDVVEVAAPVAFEIPREGLVLRGVNFALGSATLTASSYEALDAVINSLRDWPEIRIQIEGHTSAEGAYSQRRVNNNLRLSQDRANSVMRYFIQRGIPADRLRAVGFGESMPIADNNTASGRELNRRVTLTRID